MTKINPVSFISYDTCPKCNSKNIQLIDYFGNKISYSYLVGLKCNGININTKINKTNIMAMICDKCKTQYIIEWIDNGSFPIPMYNNLDLESFKYKFINE